MNWWLIQEYTLPSPIVYPPQDPEIHKAVMKTRQVPILSETFAETT